MGEIDITRYKIRGEAARSFYEASEVSKTIPWFDLPEATRDSFYFKGDNLISRLKALGVVIKGKSTGFSHSRLADYFTVESLTGGK